MNDQAVGIDAPINLQGEVMAPSVPDTTGAITVPIPGVVTQQIGSGEHAQNSIVYRTILWSFVGGGALSTHNVIHILLEVAVRRPFQLDLRFFCQFLLKKRAECTAIRDRAVILVAGGHV